MEFTLYKSQCHERHPYGNDATVVAVSTLVDDIKFRFECVHFDENGVFVEYRHGTAVDTTSNTKLGSCSIHKNTLHFTGNESTALSVISNFNEIFEQLKQTNVNDIEDESSLYESLDNIDSGVETTETDEYSNNEPDTLIPIEE